MVNILIIGSCVTRDAFTPIFMKDDFKVTNYFARTSLARLNFPVLDISTDQIKLESKFQKNVLKHAISGDLLTILKQSEFDYIVLDVVDDRFGLIKLDDNDIFVTFSDELKRAKFIKSEIKSKILPNTEEYLTAWECGLKKVIELVGSDRLIMNNVQWASFTNEGNPLSTPERIAFCTEVVNGLYKVASKYIPAQNFINYDAKLFVGKQNHKWGKSPFHYVDQVYLYFIERLKAICDLNS
ncbi:hypothetical protein A6M14_08275 [Acinetobacter sp. Ac_877]|uniref:DUF6270 domain-containing protein n=1 Tax=Acinetobacter portensis TaxID=1839785 RepID=UPI00128B3867|nr:hypothetical protein [Acinetobacter portensis]